MATIKYNEDENGNKRIILKNGKVSCTCCEGGCCMYPARAFVENLYTVDDLPDEILVNNGMFGLADKVFTKTGGNVIFYEATHGALFFSVQILTFFTPGGEERIIWSLTEGVNETGLSSLPDCLIVADNEADPSKDTFADTYTIQFYGSPPDGPFIGTTTATRVSLCRWEFTAIGGTCGAGQTGALIYENNFLPEARFWRIVIGSCEGDEESINNTTPLGTYLSADGEWRVV
jgi:hypothetical protein